jgi:signal transduction histidine kinase
VTLIQDLTSDLPLTLGDAPSLEQVLLNLIMNAMDAMRQTPEPQRRITVRTEPGKDGGVVMAVEDRGHGIAPEAMSHLFESFFTTKPEGMGVGLSTARSIVLAHRGRIWPENRADGGVTFFVALPSAEALKSSEHAAPDPLLVARMPQSAPSIKVNTTH